MVKIQRVSIIIKGQHNELAKIGKKDHCKVIDEQQTTRDTNGKELHHSKKCGLEEDDEHIMVQEQKAQNFS